MQLRWLGLVLVPTAALARPVAPARPVPATVQFARNCPDGGCMSRIAVDTQGAPLHFATPHGFTAPEIQALYNIDPNLGEGKTIAIVDAYGYDDLEADLAVYRSTFALPECTVASGCLTILNNSGTLEPRQGEVDPGWIGETALDVQMVSAACPKCKIVVIQTQSNQDGLEIGQLVARKLGVDAISNSWGGGEGTHILASEGDYNNPGIGTFASTGDDGFTGGPEYPATSAYVVAVGGTSVSSTGVVTAWSGAGSGCSAYIQPQPWAPSDALCGMRAAADVSALADPLTGVAVYNAKQGKWTVVGGTSAAAPITAAVFTGAGHAAGGPAFIYKHREAFIDVMGGANGTCGNLCEANAGWDGPTGVGTLDQQKLVAIGNVAGAGPAVTIAYPADGADVKKAFTIQAAPDPATTAYIDIQLDGVSLALIGADPWLVSAPSSLPLGEHTLTVIAYDADHNSQTATATVNRSDSADPATDGGGCSTGHGTGSLAALGLASLAAMRRRKRC